MSVRKVPFELNEYYHCFNRGVEKRIIFLDTDDFQYFLDTLELFNQVASRGAMQMYRYKKHYTALKSGRLQKLVHIHSYCLLPNHFHLLLEPLVNGGITKFMSKVCTGYSMYFNKKYKRNGTLFQGRFKSVHIESDAQMRQLFAYINFNFQVHGIKNPKMYRSSISELTQDKKILQKICEPTFVFHLFGEKSSLAPALKGLIRETVRKRKLLKENSEHSEFLE